MYTILENARIVIALLKKHKIRHIVLSPGGSNIPIVQGVQQDPFFKCYSVVDERSAMYFAIGLHLQTGEIVATSCTSAQATRNYVPGLTEAYYKHVPILAITMSKHPKYLGQEYMQCPVQTSLPVDAVKRSYSLPRIKDEHDREQCVRTANEAILELTHHGNGPVQLNIEELDSETWVFDENIEHLPGVRSIKRYSYWDELGADELRGKKVMLLIGEHMPFSNGETAAIEAFAESCNMLIYSDHTSNYRGKYALNANALTACMTPALFLERYKPDVLITIGGLTGDYPIYTKLYNAPEGSIEHWRVSMDGNVIDTYGKLTRVYEMRVEDFCLNMTGPSTVAHDYYMMWNEGVKSINYDIDIPLSNLYAAIRLSKHIPAVSCMNYAILNSLRVWSFVQIPQQVKAFSNVAAFGIDGCLSTALGTSMETDALCFHVSGDLAYFYDMNALGIRHISNNVRILLCNNNGGMEFKFGNLVNKTDVGSYIAADNHFRNSEGWARTNNFEYIPVRTKEEFDAAISVFVSPSDRPVMIEIFTNPDNERQANSKFSRLNWKGSDKEEAVKKFKSEVKSIIGEETIQVIKKIVKK